MATFMVAFLKGHVLIKKIFFALISMFLSFSVLGFDIPSSPNSRVLDYSNVLTTSQQKFISTKLNDIYNKESETEIQILIIPELSNNQNLTDFSLNTFNKWKLGNKTLNNGALITIVSSTNEIRIATGSGLDGALPDSYLGRIFDENNIKNQLINKNYYPAINTVIESMNYKILKENFGTQTHGIKTNTIIALVVLIIGILIIGAFIPVGDSVLTYYLIQILFQIILPLLSGGKIGGGGGSSGGGTSR